MCVTKNLCLGSPTIHPIAPLLGGAYLAKSDSAKSETAVQERAKPYFAKPVI